MFLTPEEIRQLTKRERPAAQIRHLIKVGIPHLVNGDGWPVVLRSVLAGAPREEIVCIDEQGFCADFFNTPWVHCGMTPRAWFQKNAIKFFRATTEILEAAVAYENTAPSCAGVYFLILKDRIIYVGLSKQINYRLIQHVADRKPFDRIFCILDIPLLFLESVESFYIDTLEPPLNFKPGTNRAMWNAIKDDITHEPY